MTVIRLLLSICIPTIVCTAPAIGFDDQGRGQRPANWKRDATINDVFFFDRKYGWAVGDQGLILRTVNGGLDWEQCEDAGLDLDDNRSLEDKIANMRPVNQVHELYSITCSLKSVFFINEQRGWIAGNYYTPLLNRSHGVILQTTDGGKSWHSVKNSFLPEINRVYFQHVLGGWALGRSGSLHKSGILTTSSGGSNWSSQSVEPKSNFLDGDLVPSGFIVVDDRNRLGKVSGQQLEIAVILGGPNEAINSVRMRNAKQGWAVGDNGTILATHNGGTSWNHLKVTPEQKQQLRQFNFSSLSIVDDRVFVAGSPGNQIFSFSVGSDPAETTNVVFHSTGIQTPLSKLTFVDSDHGWAVGSLGTIIATHDGGDSWKVQRNSHERVAILAACPRIADLPLAFLSRYSGDERYVSGCMLTQVQAQLDRSLAAAALGRVGCSCLVNINQDVSPNKNEDHELEMMVRSIRTYQPNIFVCSAASNSFVAKCRSAIELAANPNAYPEQIRHLGRAPWKVDRLVVRTKDRSEFLLQAERFLPSSGVLLQDQIAIARSLVGLSPVYRSTEHYRVESYTGSINAIGDDIMYGLETLGREIPRREAGDQRGSLGSFATSPLKLEKLKEILALAPETANRKQVETMIRGFGGGQDAREQGIWLWQLADELQLSGQTQLAALALDHLSTRFRNHPLTPAALIWLINHYSSSEVDARVCDQLKESLADFDPAFQHASKVETVVDDDGMTHLKWEKNENRGTDITPAEYIEEAIQAIRRNRTQMAAALLNRLRQRDPDLAMSEPVRFLEAKVTSQTPGPNSAENLYKNIRTNGHVLSPFRFAASRELRAQDELFNQSLPVCFEAESKPLLDGELDDQVWQDALSQGHARMRLVTPIDSKSPTNTDISWLAYDDEFLYLAARCCIQSTHHCKELRGVRTRDPDLQRYDRIRLELDLDRDLQSTFVFEVDSCGRAAESCVGSTGWNPKWYVASKKDATAWTVECAIPLNELVGEATTLGELIAHRLARLDCNSIDLWSQSEQRVSESKDAGLIAGLKIEPKRYEFLRFTKAKPDSEPVVKLP